MLQMRVQPKASTNGRSGRKSRRRRRRCAYSPALYLSSTNEEQDNLHTIVDMKGCNQTRLEGDKQGQNVTAGILPLRARNYLHFRFVILRDHDVRIVKGCMLCDVWKVHATRTPHRKREKLTARGASSFLPPLRRRQI